MQATAIKNDFNFYMHDGSTAFSFELAGSISDSAVRELRQAWRTASSIIGGRSLVIDLSYVTQVDETGERLLRDWHAAGAELVANRPQARKIVAAITGQPFEVVAEVARYHTWHAVHAFLMVAVTVLLFPAPAIALFRG